MKPWMKFYPSDWRSDPMLRLCSLAARGLWAEMMCLMHEATPYGSLLVNGKRLDKKQLASLIGVPERECSALLMELEMNGVFSRDEDGTIFSRRMRRDEAKAIEDKENGKRGGNPKVKGGVNPPDNPPDKGEVKAQIPEARNDSIGGARATSKFTEGSKALTQAFWKALGFKDALSVPPEFAGVDWRAVEWEAAGWTPDLIEVEAKRIGPAKPLSYHEKVFATAFAKRKAALPTAPIQEVSHAKSPPARGGITAALDRLIAQAETGGSSESGSPAPRIISHR